MKNVNEIDIREYIEAEKKFLKALELKSEGIEDINVYIDEGISRDLAEKVIKNKCENLISGLKKIIII